MMKINITKMANATVLEPLTCQQTLSELKIDNIAYGERLHLLLLGCLKDWRGHWAENFFPSIELVTRIAKCSGKVIVTDENGEVYAEIQPGNSINQAADRVMLDHGSMIIRYPWDILTLNERFITKLSCSEIKGTLRDGVTVDGNIRVGAGSIILPGVYIEGNIVIGEHCKIGPNCYLRGNTSIGNHCHIGQAVEVKNSLLMDNVSAGHLSYIGDSIVCSRTNFGAGTITANFRHDGNNHRSMVEGKLLDTGLRKFGAIIGENVHTGTHTSIYPGRKIWANCSTLPGAIVQKDVRD